jgi:hypothetical protein
MLCDGILIKRCNLSNPSGFVVSDVGRVVAANEPAEQKDNCRAVSLSAESREKVITRRQIFKGGIA